MVTYIGNQRGPLNRTFIPTQSRETRLATQPSSYFDVIKIVSINQKLITILVGVGRYAFECVCGCVSMNIRLDVCAHVVVLPEQDMGKDR